MPTPTIKVGDTVTDGTFTYIPYSPELDDHSTCGVPIKLNISKEWKGKKVVLFAVPGAFTYDDFKAKGVDVIAVVAANDVFVMSGWGRFEGLKDKILTLSDPNAKWSKKLGLDVDLSARAFGIRTARYGMILEDLVVKYIEVEPAPGVTVTGAEAVLAKL